MTPRERNLADIGLIALRHGFTHHDVLGRSRDQKIVAARRQVAAHFAGLGKKVGDIGRIMQRDRTTVRYYLKGKRR